MVFYWIEQAGPDGSYDKNSYVPCHSSLRCEGFLVSGRRSRLPVSPIYISFFAIIASYAVDEIGGGVRRARHSNLPNHSKIGKQGQFNLLNINYWREFPF